MEARATPQYAREGAAVLQYDGVQPREQRRHVAVLSRTNEGQRSSLSRSRPRGRRDSRAAWLSAVVARSRVAGSVGPRDLRLQAKRTLGLDCALSRPRLARSQAGLSIAPGS